MLRTFGQVAQDPAGAVDPAGGDDGVTADEPEQPEAQRLHRRACGVVVVLEAVEDLLGDHQGLPDLAGPPGGTAQQPEVRGGQLGLLPDLGEGAVRALPVTAPEGLACAVEQRGVPVHRHLAGRARARRPPVPVS
ncbi:hypothetical protein [Georgenia sp. H159]|uniref:hypothetical protein n=1 Tax=Georgenia sp. H159 TaxID=3076115 RepID=UPI002D7943FF|nr:hypothetical protein [Georgenia sp. H159]